MVQCSDAPSVSSTATSKALNPCVSPSGTPFQSSSAANPYASVAPTTAAGASNTNGVTQLALDQANSWTTVSGSNSSSPSATPAPSATSSTVAAGSPNSQNGSVDPCKQFIQKPLQ